MKKYITNCFLQLVMKMVIENYIYMFKNNNMSKSQHNINH